MLGGKSIVAKVTHSEEHFTLLFYCKLFYKTWLDNIYILYTHTKFYIKSKEKKVFFCRVATKYNPSRDMNIKTQ